MSLSGRQYRALARIIGECWEDDNTALSDVVSRLGDWLEVDSPTFDRARWLRAIDEERKLAATALEEGPGEDYYDLRRAPHGRWTKVDDEDL